MLPGIAKKAWPYLALAVLAWAWMNEHNERVKEIGAAEYRAAEATARIGELKPQLVVITREVQVTVQDVLTQGRRYKAAKEELARAIPPDSLHPAVVALMAEGDAAVTKSVALATACATALDVARELVKNVEKERDAYKDLQPTAGERLRNAGMWAAIGGAVTLVLEALVR